jgi:hypothetical protein
LLGDFEHERVFVPALSRIFAKSAESDRSVPVFNEKRSSALSDLKSGVSILLAVDLRGNRKLEAYATTPATLKFIFDRALVVID